MVGDAQEQARMRIYDGKFEIHVRRTPALVRSWRLTDCTTDLSWIETKNCGQNLRHLDTWRPLTLGSDLILERFSMAGYYNGVHDPKITNTSSRFTRDPDISPLF